ncbi:MAG: hypothetical protein KJ057_01165 [Phycisphaerae bacterium]|nr:MAG: hypothetical protein EDS66_10375 [Planctomycetota bacterium]KAB2941339.1 MAG: hypothetical protein F9K17_13105 [Phycisphaerae bacterium]MBE7455806.1 hypothetical protein [Planctomycetia bacterium]MCK6463441.1 hypothetical protein [Phycisphaerae bacterium]MCL4717064.1 hypothetical protein [Phycisphaerae bacterium]
MNLTVKRILVGWLVGGAASTALAAPRFRDVTSESHEASADESAEGAAATLARRYRLDLTDPFLNLESSLESRRVTSDPSGLSRIRRTDRALEFRESLGFTLDGHAFGEETLQFSGDVELGLAQSRFHRSVDGISETDTDSGTLVRYDLALTLFPDEPASFDAYARRSRDRIPRRFLPSLIEDNEEYGIAFHLTTPTTRTDVGFDLSDVQRTGNVSGEDDESRERARFHVDHRWDISDGHGLRLTYDHENVESKYQGSRGSLDTRRDELRVEHRIEFGREGRHAWDLLLRHNDEEGDLARDETEFAPRLTFQHTDRLQTTWRYNLYKTDQDGLSIDRHKADVEAAWGITDELRLTADAFWRVERVEDDVETYEYGGLLDMSFDHPTPWGRLTIDGAIHLVRAETTGDGPISVVRGETHTLDTVRPAVLRKSDVRRFSLRAFNASRTRIYTEGLDYTVTQAGRLTFIRRILSGDIADGEAVSFDYEYRVPTGSRTDTVQSDLRIEHAFDGGLTPYYLWQNRRQWVDEPEFRRPFAADFFDPVFDAFADNTDHHRLGLRYERDRWTVSGEFELFNDSVLPYEAWHVSGRADLLRSPGHTLDASAMLSHFRFDGDFDPRRVTAFDADLKDTLQFSDHLSTSLGVGYRHERDSIDGTTQGVDLEGTIRLTRGLLDVELTAEYDLLDIGDGEDRGYGVWLNVRRELSDLVRR